MLVARRALGVTAASAVILLAGCGGLGVDIGGTHNPTQVAITAPTGSTLNPYPLLIGHTVVLTAHPSAGNSINYIVAVPVTWDSNNPLVGQLLEPGCNAAYGGEPTSSVCVLAGGLGKANVNIDATTSNGAIGTLTLAITN